MSGRVKAHRRDTDKANLSQELHQIEEELNTEMYVTRSTQLIEQRF